MLMPNARQRGFTLIELLVVIAIISVLASIVLSSLSSSRIKARDTKGISMLKQLQNAVELYATTNGNYPGNVDRWYDTTCAGDGGPAETDVKTLGLSVNLPSAPDTGGYGCIWYVRQPDPSYMNGLTFSYALYFVPEDATKRTVFNGSNCDGWSWYYCIGQR